MAKDFSSIYWVTIVRKNIHKPKHDEHSIVTYNYPYQALEESLVNVYYHRRYDEYQLVEVNIMPDQIEIISYGGAERSIKLDDLRAGKRSGYMPVVTAIRVWVSF